jgi:hypothetical protein
MAQVDSTSFDAALKEYYTDEYVRDMVYDDNPWFAMVPKLTTLTGDTYVQPIQYGIPTSRSATFADALALKDVNKYKKFNVTTADDYAMISIGRKVMKQSANDRGAFFEARTREIDGMIKSLVRSMSQALYGNGGGSLGQVAAASAFSTTTCTLMEPEDIVNFEVGMELEFATTDGTSGALVAGSATVTGIDRDAGTLTSDSNWTTQIPLAANSGYLFAKGDFGNKLKGLLAWVPASAPSATSFYGVDRTADVTRLGGVRISAANDPIREALRKGASRLGREGASPDIVLMSHQKYRDLLIELDNKVEYSTTNVTANVGFTGVKIVGAKKPLTIYADHNCPDKYAFMLTKDTWKLVSLGAVPDLHDEDGLRMLRESTSDGFEVRASYYAALSCAAPGHNAIITLE